MAETCKMQRNCIMYSSLWSMIHLWLNNHGSHHHYDFKVSIQKMHEVNPVLKQKCIEYLLLRKFSWMVKDFNKDLVIRLNMQLKQQYQKLVIGNFLKQKSNFEVLTLYLIKLTVRFLNDIFSNFLADFVLQSEMFVILYYTFLGIEISDKSYEIINKKYIFKNALNHNAATNSQQKIQKQKQIKTSKSSFLNNNTQSLKKVTNFGRFSKIPDQMRLSRQSWSKFSRETPRRDSLADFTVLLKENLHVDPLPPVKQRKLRIQQLERLNTEPAQVKNRQLSPIEAPKEDFVSFVIKKKHLFSNQLSNSIKTVHPQNLSFQLNSKKFKYNQSFYDKKFDKKLDISGQVTSHQKILSEKVPNDSSLMKNSLQRNKATDWKEVVQELKKKVIDLKEKNNGSTDRRQHRNHKINTICEEQKSTNTTQLYIETPKMGQKESEPKSSQIEKVIEETTAQLEFKKQNSKNMNEYFSIHTYQESSCKIPHQSIQLGRRNKNLLTKKSIRLDKDSFNSNCSVRKSELMNVPKINLHAEWIINHYKQ